MTFLWPTWLWSMPALLLLPPLYLWLLRRRGKPALRYSGLAVVREASGRPRWRRHVPPALLWLACAALLLAAARPVAKVTLPWARTQILLAMDVSLSTRVQDVLPTRLAAAQEAAALFLHDLPKGIEVGLVTFAGSAQIVQPATLDRNSLVAAIDAFQMQYGPAIVVCLAELFPEHGISLGDMTFGAWQGGMRSREETSRGPTAAKPIAPVAPGSYGSAAILLLSDGRRTTGIDTLDLAKMAADRGRRRPGDLHAARRADLARGGADDRRRVPPRGHGGGVAERVPGLGVAAAGADSGDGDHGGVGAGKGGGGGVGLWFGRVP